MTNNTFQTPSIPNPALESFGVLIGNWTTVCKHPSVPSATFQGQASVEWFAGGAFLVMRVQVEKSFVPTSVSVIGSDDKKQAFFMLYADERGVSRKFEISLNGNEWKIWRNISGFSQRFEGTITDDSNTILGVWELSEDDITWKRDLEITYTKIK